jgi:hypothetical protein
VFRPSIPALTGGAIASTPLRGFLFDTRICKIRIPHLLSLAAARLGVPNRDVEREIRNLMIPCRRRRCAASLYHHPMSPGSTKKARLAHELILAGLR